MLDIVIACGSMPFGPNTLKTKSLGGSETAALMLGKTLAARGHNVTMFCNLDDWPSGNVHEDKVRYVSLEHFEAFVSTHRHDLLISVRDPQFVALPSQSVKKVLWMHDIATKRGMQRALDQMSWTFDEIWTVSEWHRQQVAETTGYPLENIVALRNGIVPVTTDQMFPRSEKTILYAARPERGLDNLIRPGGIMDHLPDYNLKVCMYDHFPEHMRDYYNSIFQRMNEMPNVEFLGPKPQNELRQLMRESAAYIYPTQFEETSCIIARECIEQETPFFTTLTGALPETLGECGIYFEHWLQDLPGHGVTEPEKGSLEWCELFAKFFRQRMENHQYLVDTQFEMHNRTDLYWDGVAAMVEENAVAEPVTMFSRIWSLMQDGDIVVAKELLDYAGLGVGASGSEVSRKAISGLFKEVSDCYPFLFDKDFDMAKFYDNTYKDKSEEETELVFRTEGQSLRYEVIAEELSALPPGSRVLEYGCGPGHLLAPLAKRFPLLDFVGIDFAGSAVDVVNDGAEEYGIENLHAWVGDTSLCSEFFKLGIADFDAVICSEVLEHVLEPWKLLSRVEQFAKVDGRMLFTVPFGAWEPIGYERQGYWKERNHLWHIDKQMFKDMCGDKPNEKFLALSAGYAPDMRGMGQLFYAYNADFRPANAVDLIDKANRHISRQTCAAAVIAYNNEDTILRLLNSIEKQVQFVQFALGPCTDCTRPLIENWFAERPWMRYNIVDVPKIEPWKFGFDDARNASIAGLDAFDWVLWIDTDEYLSGDFRKYLRSSSLDAYLVAQHHFTCVPRGNPPEIDKPARLFKANHGFQAHGHIHEHFEVAEGGPGRAFLLPDVDIGHSGYVNEDVRKGRFFRNFPFLEWDHETEGADRKLHKFLWFRDIIHRMRFTQDQRLKVTLAKEAVAYYNEFQSDMSAFGPGIFLALRYMAEAYTILNIGVPVQATIALDDRSADIVGRFESYEQFERVVRQLLEGEFKDRNSRYW